MQRRTLHYRSHSSKRGSLNLSINAIVVLILAITMLGLGLGFIRNIFIKADKLVDVDDMGLQKRPGPDDPITVSPSKITMKMMGTESNVGVAYYNADANEKKCTLTIVNRADPGATLCGDNLDTCPFGPGTVTFLYDDLTQVTIPPGKDQGWKIIVKEPDEKTVDFFSAKLACDDSTSYSKDFTLDTQG